MFFEGSLQEGISKALQEQKLVACLVTNDIDESLRWEAWLKNDDQLRQKIDTTAVLLKLVSGGQEAGYLAAFCPLETTPALVVIRNGIPTAHLKPSLEESEFKDALADALEGGDSGNHMLSSNISSRMTTQEQNIVQAPNPLGPTSVSSSIHPNTTQSATPPVSSPNSTSTSTSTANKEEIEKAKRAAQIKKEQADALAERRRILAQIESDKKARQAQEAERKKNLRIAKEQEEQEIKQAQNTARRAAKECALKVRTFDGATIASTFSSDQTLHKHVRSWIDQTIEGLKEPYEFKWLLAPMPNRRISASEEEETLVSLGLTPSATLVMVPMKGYSTAYSENWPGIIGSTVSFVHGIVTSCYGMVSHGVSMASNLVGSLLGRTESGPGTEEDQQSTETNSSSTRVRTLADQRRNQDEQQLYNGNQLNFERRKDDEDD